MLTLRLVFHLALRQAEAFVGSILRLLGLDLSVPDHSTLSRRGRAFAGRCSRVLPSSGPTTWCWTAQPATGFGRRNHAETTMGRYKHLIGPKLHARALPGQGGEVAIAVSVLNRMERLRVEAARHLLAETALPQKRVAQRCGFGTEETMRRSFLRIQGVGPGEYRERFSAYSATSCRSK